eukprot:6187742-Amphidinium_carterae.1
MVGAEVDHWYILAPPLRSLQWNSVRAGCVECHGNVLETVKPTAFAPPPAPPQPDMMVPQTSMPQALHEQD